MFFSNEEVGRIGSSKVDMEFFSDCGFLLQGDRRGSGDIICDSICSKDFLDLLELVGASFGYSKGIGSYTDVTKLSERNVGVSCANLSIGYYNAHMDSEYTIWEELLNARYYIL